MQQGIHSIGRNDSGHIVFVYASHAERTEALAQYFGKGIEDNALCILVTPEPLADVQRSLLAAGLDISQALASKQLQIFMMGRTYLPDGSFNGTVMLANVKGFLAEARSKGYSGLRTAGEMDWLYETPSNATEAELYEHQVTSLQAANPDFTGLCLYPLRRGASTILAGALRSHPEVVFDGASL